MKPPTPNPAAALDGGRPVLLTILLRWAAASEPRCSVAEECSQIQTQERKEKANDNEESNQRKSNH
jgi:hypothetical protein